MIYASTICAVYTVCVSLFAMGYVPSTSCGYIFSLISAGSWDRSISHLCSTLHSRVRGYSFIPGVFNATGSHTVSPASFTLSISRPDFQPQILLMSGSGASMGMLTENSLPHIRHKCRHIPGDPDVSPAYPMELNLSALVFSNMPLGSMFAMCPV